MTPYKKPFKKATKALKKRYFKGKGYKNPKLMQMASDMLMLKDMVNAEKEVYDALTLQGQNVDLSTPYFDKIVNVSEGTGHGARDGESLKLHGYRWNLRVMQQASVTNKIQAKIWLVKFIGPRGTTPSVSTFLRSDFDGNYSVYSERNEDWYGSYQIVAYSGLMTVPQDNVSGQTQFTTKRLYGRFKGKTHQRYSSTGQDSLLTDQMYVIVVVSGGNTATSTGVKVDSKLLISFYDN